MPKSPSLTSPDPDAVAVLDDDARVGAILSPLRRRILGRLHAGPDSASGLARKLEMPRQKLNYHLRELERTGFLELAETRQRRGCVERTLRPTARAYLVSPALLGALTADPETFHDRFSSGYQMAVAGRLLRDVAGLRQGAAKAAKRLPTLTLETTVRFSGPEARAAFAEELADAVARLTTKYHDEGAGSRAFRFVIAGHPQPNFQEDSHHEQDRDDAQP